MSDLRDVFDQMIHAAGKLAAAGIHSDMVREANRTDARQCGNCEYWMQSRNCPREENVNGQNRGPSASAWPCEKYAVKDYVVQLKVKRLEEARKYAEEHGLTAGT
jgi:hypothetical protein